MSGWRLPIVASPWLLVATVAAAVPPSLEPIPTVSLQSAEPAVREQIEQQSRQLAEAQANPDTPPKELARAYGGLGEIYLVYDLSAPAAAALRNAGTLDPSEPRWPYLLGTLQQVDRDYQAAADWYRGALALQPDIASAVIRLGDVLVRLGRWQEAGAQYRRALELAEDQPGFRAAAEYGLGRVAQETGRAQEAVQHFQRTLELQPDAGQARYQLALALRDTGERDRARELLGQPHEGEVRFPDPIASEIQGQAKSVGALLALGRMALGRDDLASARERFESALAIDPQSGAAHRSLAGVLQREGDADRALEEYEAAARLEPQAAGLRYYLAGLHVDRARRQWGQQAPADSEGLRLDQLEGDARESARKDLEAAVEHLEAALAQAPDFFPGWVELAGAYAGLGRAGDGAHALERALALRPDSADLRRYRARLLAQAGDVDGAVAELDRVADQPDAGQARVAAFEAARVVAQAGRSEEAEKRYQALIDSAPDPATRGLAEFHLGNLAMAAGRSDEARRHFEGAVRADPKIAEAHFNLATLLGRQGDYRAAADEHARVLELQPDNHQARFGRAMALVLAGDYGAAATVLREALDKYPSGAVYAHLLARILVAAPDEGVRDGATGLDLARRLFEALPTPEHAETLAMALAETGDFEGAVSLQERVVQELEQAGREDLAAPARSLLDGYRQGKPARSPWAPP